MSINSRQPTESDVLNLASRTYGVAEMVTYDDIPQFVRDDLRQSSNKFLFFRVPYMSDYLPITGIWVTMPTFAMFSKYKKGVGIYLSRHGEQMFVWDGCDSEYCITPDDYRLHRVRINTMREVNKTLKNYMEDIYESYQEHRMYN